MGLSVIDLIIIVLYLILAAVIGSLSGGKQKNIKDYFLGGTSVPWWAVAFSIVAAETSSLTFISIPGLAYLTNLNFLQLTIGFLTARVIIALVFLPAYKKGELKTAYAFLGERFGQRTQRFASIVFLFTRIAADGVRLFATAIPLAIILKAAPWFQDWSNFQIYLISIILIAIISLIYTYTGGMKGVIWADVLQMSIYVGGAIIALFILWRHLPADFSIPAEKWQVFNLDFGQSLADFFRKPYTLLGALIGGTFLSLASHGTDQLIVQRLLSTPSLKDSQKAIITSGVIIIFQFALFLVVGLLLYAFYHGISIASPDAPFHKPDEIFPYFIIH
ncbi:sodium:solute symporter family transporter, partial [Caldithrix abyssi]